MNHNIDWSDCKFYRFVTLTSHGGELVPLSPQARSLTILENVSGVLYVAVFVARLVGAYSSSTAISSHLSGLPSAETKGDSNDATGEVEIVRG